MLILALFLIKLMPSVQRHVQMVWPGHLCGTWRVRDTKQCLLTVSLAPLGWWRQTGFGTGLSHHVAVGHCHTMIFHLSILLVSPSAFWRGFTNVFLVSSGSSLLAYGNNMKRNGTCSAGSLAVPLLL